MYRPDNWEDIKQSILEEPNGMDKYCCADCGDKILEAGIDAILEALKKGAISENHDDDDYIAIEITKGTGLKKGYLVFFPEE